MGGIAQPSTERLFTPRRVPEPWPPRIGLDSRGSWACPEQSRMARVRRGGRPGKTEGPPTRRFTHNHKVVVILSAAERSAVALRVSAVRPG